MGYEHLSIIPETESNKVTESNVENLLPIPSECEVTSEDESECDMPAKDDCSPAFTTFSNPLFNNNDDLDSSDDESLTDENVPAEEFKVYSNPLFDEDEINYDKLDPRCFNVESDFVESLLNRDTFIDSSSKFDFSSELAHINPEILEFDFDFDEKSIFVKICCMIIHLYNRQKNIMLMKNVSRESMLAISVIWRCCLQSTYDSNSQREEIDIVTDTKDVLPPGVENDDDSDGEVDVVDDLRVDNSISNYAHEYSESEESDFDNPSVPLPPPEPPDAEFNFELDAEKEIPVVKNEKDEFDVSNDDYFPFMIVIQIFQPYLICSKMFLSFLFSESEDTIFDPVLLKLILSVHRIRRRRYNLIPAESKFKNLVLDHQDKYMMKAQVHVSKSSAISDIQALPRRKHYCQIYPMINFSSGVKWNYPKLSGPKYRAKSPFVLPSSGYGVLDLVSFVVFGKVDYEKIGRKMDHEEGNENDFKGLAQSLNSLDTHHLRKMMKMRRRKRKRKSQKRRDRRRRQK
nr:hypothetical protein [Tanacetum cinerariifolium]